MLRNIYVYKGSIAIIYSKIPILGPPLGLSKRPLLDSPKGVLWSEVHWVLKMKKQITETLQIKFLIAVLILGGLNSGISLYIIWMR